MGHIYQPIPAHQHQRLSGVNPYIVLEQPRQQQQQQQHQNQGREGCGGETGSDQHSGGSLKRPLWVGSVRSGSAGAVRVLFVSRVASTRHDQQQHHHNQMTPSAIFPSHKSVITFHGISMNTHTGAEREEREDLKMPFM